MSELGADDRHNSTIFSQTLKLTGHGDQGYNTYADKHMAHPLGGLVELVDNAQEAGAKLCTITQDKTVEGLVFQDDGIGMDRATICRLLKFGGSEKTEETLAKNNYGVGFKSGCLGVAKESFVFSKSLECEKCGSTDEERLRCFQTQCCASKRRIWSMARISRDQELGWERERVLRVPVLFWDGDGNLIEDHTTNPPFVHPDNLLAPKVGQISKEGLKKSKVVDNMKFNTIFRSKAMIQQQFDAIPGDRGTRILLTDFELIDHNLELEINSEEKDVLIKNMEQPFFATEEHVISFQGCTKKGHDIPIDYSLRAYLEVLYRWPDEIKSTFDIEILGLKVEFQRIEYRFCRDDISKQYMRTYEFEGDCSRDGKRQSYSITLGYSVEDEYRGTAGTFYYFNKCDKCARGTGQSDGSCCPPSRLVHSYKPQGVQKGDEAGGLIGVIVLRSPAFTIDNGKQKFKQRLDSVNSKIADFARQYKPTYDEAKRRVKDDHQIMIDREMDNGHLCLVQRLFLLQGGAKSTSEKDKPARQQTGGGHEPRQDTDRFPCRILNKWERGVLRDYAPRRASQAQGPLKQEKNPVKYTRSHEWYLVEIFGGDEKDWPNCFRAWVHRDHMEKWDENFEVCCNAQKNGKEEALNILRSEEWMPDSKLVKRYCIHCEQTRQSMEEEEGGDFDEHNWNCRLGYVEDGIKKTACPVQDKGNPRQVTAANELPGPSNLAHMIEEVDIVSYEKLDKLGGGVQGEVYVVKKEGKRYAAKYFHVGTHAEWKTRFEQECHALATMNACENCVRIVGKHTSSNQPALLMELCEYDLQNAVTEQNLTFHEYLRLAVHVARGMRRVYEANLIHADLKLTNILISWEESGLVAKVADFGFSKNRFLGAETSMTAPDNFYTAPEVSKRETAPSEKSDVYSFGWILAQTTAGALSKWHTQDLRASAQHEKRFDEELVLLMQAKDKGVSELVNRCWDMDPQKRPSFKEIKQTLMEIAQRCPMHVGEEVRQYVDRHCKSSIVYRVLDDEDIRSLYEGKGILGGTPHNRVQSGIDNSVNLHVRHGQNTAERSGYISMSRHFQWTLWYAQKKALLKGDEKPLKRSKEYKWYGIVAVDVRKCPDVKIIDISSHQIIKQSPEGRSLSPLAQAFAAAAKEVILMGNIPQDAIVDRFEIDPDGYWGKMFKTAGENHHEECLNWYKKKKLEVRNVKKKFQGYYDWEKEFSRHAVGGTEHERFKDECRKRALKSVDDGHWPIPKGKPVPPKWKRRGERSLLTRKRAADGAEAKQGEESAGERGRSKKPRKTSTPADGATSAVGSTALVTARCRFFGSTTPGEPVCANSVNLGWGSAVSMAGPVLANTCAHTHTTHTRTTERNLNSGIPEHKKKSSSKVATRGQGCSVSSTSESDIGLPQENEAKGKYKRLRPAENDEEQCTKEASKSMLSASCAQPEVSASRNSRSGRTLAPTPAVLAGVEEKDASVKQVRELQKLSFTSAGVKTQVQLGLRVSKPKHSQADQKEGKREEKRKRKDEEGKVRERVREERKRKEEEEGARERKMERADASVEKLEKEKEQEIQRKRDKKEEREMEKEMEQEQEKERERERKREAAAKEDAMKRAMEEGEERSDGEEGGRAGSFSCGNSDTGSDLSCGGVEEEEETKRGGEGEKEGEEWNVFLRNPSWRSPLRMQCSHNEVVQTDMQPTEDAQGLGRDDLTDQLESCLFDEFQPCQWPRLDDENFMS